MPIVEVRNREVCWIADDFEGYFADFLARAAEGRPAAVDVLAEILSLAPRALDPGEATPPEWYRRVRG
jgi:hypothetical protein